MAYRSVDGFSKGRHGAFLPTSGVISARVKCLSACPLLRSHGEIDQDLRPNRMPGTLHFEAPKAEGLERKYVCPCPASGEYRYRANHSSEQWTARSRTLPKAASLFANRSARP